MHCIVLVRKCILYYLPNSFALLHASSVISNLMDFLVFYKLNIVGVPFEVIVLQCYQNVNKALKNPSIFSKSAKFSFIKWTNKNGTIAQKLDWYSSTFFTSKSVYFSFILVFEVYFY